MYEQHALYQGKQTVVAAGGGYPHGYKQVNTYSGSQRGWMIDCVAPDQVEATKIRQLQRLGKMIATHEIACTNRDMRIHATRHYLTSKLIKGNETEH